MMKERYEQNANSGGTGTTEEDRGDSPKKERPFGVAGGGQKDLVSKFNAKSNGGDAPVKRKSLINTSSKGSSRFGGGGLKCVTCTKTVYLAEKLEYDGKAYHKLCFRCLQCNIQPTIKNVAVYEGKLFCKSCFVSVFKSGGGKYGSSFGEKDGTEGDDKPAAAPKPKAAAAKKRRSSLPVTAIAEAKKEAEKESPASVAEEEEEEEKPKEKGNLAKNMMSKFESKAEEAKKGAPEKIKPSIKGSNTSALTDKWNQVSDSAATAKPAPNTHTTDKVKGGMAKSLLSKWENVAVEASKPVAPAAKRASIAAFQEEFQKLDGEAESSKSEKVAEENNEAVAEEETPSKEEPAKEAEAEVVKEELPAHVDELPDNFKEYYSNATHHGYMLASEDDDHPDWEVRFCVLLGRSEIKLFETHESEPDDSFSTFFLQTPAGQDVPIVKAQHAGHAAISIMVDDKPQYLLARDEAERDAWLAALAK